MDVKKILTGMIQCSKVTANACNDCPYDNPEKDARCGKEMLNDALGYIESLQKAVVNLKKLCKDLAELVEPSVLKAYLDQYDTSSEVSDEEASEGSGPVE